MAGRIVLAMDKWISLVKARMTELKVTQEQLAERIEMSQGAVGHWLNKRREPKLEVMNRILQELGLAHLHISLVLQAAEPEGAYSVDAAQDSPQALEAPEYYFRYPVIDWDLVGRLGDPQAIYPDERFELTDYQAQGPAFWLQVQGDAMTAPIGTSVPEGMSILVDSGLEAEPGKLVIAQGRHSLKLTFRKLIEESGQLYLRPLNPTYPKVLYSEEWHVVGVVVLATIKF